MQGKELIALRNEALVLFAAQPATPRPSAARRWQRPLVILGAAVALSMALVWLNIGAVLNTAPVEEAPSVQSVSTEAQTPPPDVDIARTFEIVAASDPAERAQDAAAAVQPEPEAMLPKFLAWAADSDTSVPMEMAQPPKATPAKDAQAKVSSQDREREQEARADRKWEERHARRSAAAHKNVRRATPQPAPNASNTPPIVPRETDSWRGG
jgi:hypothetical protein